MLLYIAKRLILVVPVVFAVALVCFLLVHIAPGDPLVSVLPPDASQALAEQMRKAYGFDRPLPVQFGIWVWNAINGNLGTSIATGRSVTDSVYFLLTDKATGLSFPFTNDKPGHFRTPDVGTAIKEIGEQIDVNSFVITVNVAGYKRATITRMPRKAQGAIELDVKLEPVVSAEVLAAGLGGSDPQPYT